MTGRQGRRVGFVSTRFSGTDGVSLETRKWAEVLEGMGHECFYFAGSSDQPAERSMVVAEAAFDHPEVAAISAEAFGRDVRSPEMTASMRSLAGHLELRLAEFVERFGVEVLVAENALTIPMHLPLGLALTEYIAETRIPVIAHHHDFYWERDRFLVNCVGDVLASSFPPRLPSINHVVINSLAAMQLSLRTGVPVRVIPNVMDFDNPPAPARDDRSEVRRRLGLSADPADQRLILQPTRVVQRKGIEHAIELVRRMELPACLVVSHGTTDEGIGYTRRVREYADLLGVSLLFAGEQIGHDHEIEHEDGHESDERADTAATQRTMALGDVYRAADLVTYPSTVEGFGNALVEAIYYRRPVVVNRYSIYSLDIAPRGLSLIEFEGFVTSSTVADARRVVLDPASAAETVESNYELGRRHFSYRTLEAQLDALLRDGLGVGAD